MTLIIGKMDLGHGLSFYAITDNGEVKYQFIGKTLDDQLTSVRKLADYMAAGQQEVLSNIGNALNLAGRSKESAVEELFKVNDELTFEEEFFFDATGTATLWFEDELIAAGEALAAFLV